MTDQRLTTDVEYQLAVAHHRYERVKLVIVSTSLVILVFLVAYLVSLGQSTQQLVREGRQRSIENHQALVILRCAVSNEVSVDERGVQRTDADKRTVYEACVKRGAPREPWPPDGAKLTP